jgi:hypothetical protein
MRFIALSSVTVAMGLLTLVSQGGSSLQEIAAGQSSAVYGGACSNCKVTGLCTQAGCTQVGVGTWLKTTPTGAVGLSCVAAKKGQSGYTTCTDGTPVNCLVPSVCTDAACTNCGAAGAPSKVDSVCTTGGTTCQVGD